MEEPKTLPVGCVQLKSSSCHALTHAFRPQISLRRFRLHATSRVTSCSTAILQHPACLLRDHMCDSNKHLYHSHILEHCITHISLSPTVAKLRYTKSRSFLLFDLLSLGVKARLLQAAVSLTTPHSLIPSLQPQPRHSFPHSLSIPPPTIHPQSLLTFLDTLNTTHLHSLTT